MIEKFKLWRYQAERSVVLGRHGNRQNANKQSLNQKTVGPTLLTVNISS